MKSTAFFLIFLMYQNQMQVLSADEKNNFKMEKETILLRFCI